MAEGESGGMQEHAVSQLAVAVETVAHDRGAESLGMGGVQPELVGSAGDGSKLNSRSIAFDA